MSYISKISTCISTKIAENLFFEETALIKEKDNAESFQTLFWFLPHDCNDMVDKSDYFFVP